MSLRAFHIAFIAAALLFCFGVGGWGLWRYRDEGDATTLGMGAASLAVGVGLAVYARWFLRKKPSMGGI